MQIGHKEVCGCTPHAAGRQLLEQMYTARFGTPMPPVLKGPRGKPYFQGSSVHFSITHTPGHAFCVLADRPVGIDAEQVERQIDLRLADKILSPAEKPRYDTASDKQAAPLRLWVLKEAAGKCSGQGIRGYPNHPDFSPEDPRITIMHGCYVAVILEE